MASIYFPLRTNVEYWDLDRLELDLESRLKLSAILYDELILEDGGYVALVGPKMSLSVPVRDLDAVPEGFFEAHTSQKAVSSTSPSVTVNSRSK